MLIQKFKVKNFGPFVRNHEMSFSYGDNNNVNVILGENGTGKSSLFDALRWGFYGNNSLSKELNQYINYQSAEGANGEMSVEITFKANDHKKYILFRKQRFHKTNKGEEIHLDGQFDFKIENENGSVDDVSEDLKKLSQNPILFFVDGEKIYDFISLINDQKIKIPENFGKILESNANSLLKKWDAKNSFSRGKLKIVEGKLKLLSEDGVDHHRTLAASERILLNFLILILVKNILFPKSFLVIDSVFGHADLLTRTSLVNNIPSLLPQIILFLTDTEFLGLRSKNTRNVKEELIKNNCIVREYQIQYNLQKYSSKIIAR